MKERIEDIWSEVVIGAIIILFALIAIPVMIWKCLKGLFESEEKEQHEDVVFLYRLKSGDIRENLWLFSDHTFDVESY